MKITYIILLFFLAPILSIAQSTTKEVDSTQVANAVLDSLNIEQLPTDSAAVVNDLKVKASNALRDSLKNYIDQPVHLDSTLSDQAKQKAKNKVEQELDTNIPTDSASVANKAESLATQTLKDQTGIEVNGIPTDSASVRSEAKSLLKSEFENQTGIEAPDITIDSTTTDQIKKEAETRAEEALKNNSELGELGELDDQLGEIKDIKDKIELTQQQLKEKTARKALKQKMTSQAKSYLMENAETVQQLQSQMGELKQKYSMVPNSNDLSTAKKRSSLKGESFWKRLVVGGNLNVSKTNPITIDFSPVLGWKFNKQSEAGITGAYRAKFGADDKGINSFENEDVYGYSVFANYVVFKNFFVSLEGENMSKVVGMEEDHSREWIQTLLVGIGRKFNVTKFLEMQAIVSYNFLHDNTDNLYNSPVVFKTGFRIKK